MADTLARRGFLRQLAGLPLIGGGVTLIGNPTAAAEPVTEELLWNYSQWLQTERSLLVWEMGSQDETNRYWLNNGLGHRIDNPAGRYHQPSTPPPSTRAAVVLSAVGCGWRDGPFTGR
jgi:hypothetical protein